MRSIWICKNIKNVVKMKKKISPAGNRTPVSRVTGGDTDHYTTEDPIVTVTTTSFEIFFPHFWSKILTLNKKKKKKNSAKCCLLIEISIPYRKITNFVIIYESFM